MKSRLDRTSIIWALLVSAVVFGLWWRSQTPPIEELSPLPTTTTRSQTITVHVGGWVARPGLVELADGARVADAVAAAGGSLPGAEVESVNLAATLGDGEQVIIPGPSSGPQPSIGDSDGVVSLNRATVDELEQLPGVGPVIAQRIIEFRESHGPFDAIEDLLDVPGIGEAKLASLREHVVP